MRLLAASLPEVVTLPSGVCDENNEVGSMKWVAVSAELIRFDSIEGMDRSIIGVKIRPRNLR